ncbi:nicotinamide-nucleotide adenylyltransferase [Candidatus Parcubacteria bacterium]|nr:nicotinamide-nucleotide adenylyltransferase [Candidatus Parcubacteria bacterium]
MDALFIGRFQPFHKGHLASIKKIALGADRVFLIIGSSQESDTMDNPFSFSERREMIETCLAELGIENYKIYGVPDMDDDLLWAKKVLEVAGLEPKNAVVFTRNSWSKKCFDTAGVEVRAHPLFFKKLSATKVREKINKGEEWENLVPEPVFLFFKKIKAEKRVKFPQN